MKVWTQEHVFSQPWDIVTRAAWKKYPNPFNASVTGTDVVDRNFEHGILKTHRIMTTEWGLPLWASKLIGMDRTCYGSEVSEVDVSKKSMTLQSRNLTFKNVVSIDEKMTYEPHPKDAKKTVMRQETAVSVYGVPLSSYMEQLIVNKISVKAVQGLQAVDWVCAKINQEMLDLANFSKSSMDTLTTAVNMEMQELATSARKSMDNLKKDLGDIADTLPNLDAEKIGDRL